MRSMSVATWVIFEKISFQPEDSPNHLGFQPFGPSTGPKNLSFLFL